MNAKEEFRAAQKQYKDQFKAAKELQKALQEQHENWMEKVQKLEVETMDTLKPMRKSRAELHQALQDQQHSKHKLWKLTQSNFGKSAEHLPSNHKNQDELFEYLSSANVDELEDFSPEEKAQHKAKLQPKSSPKSTDNLPSE